MSFEERVKKFNSFYLTLVISVGALSAAAILLAVFFKASVGLAVGICGVLLYVLLLSERMKKGLGLWYRRCEDGIACSVIESKKDGDCGERHIPSRLMWLDVTELCPVCGKDRPDVQTEVLHLPCSVKRIDKDALLEMPCLKKIVYHGSAEQWTEVVCSGDMSKIEIITEQKEAEE